MVTERIFVGVPWSFVSHTTTKQAPFSTNSLSKNVWLYVAILA